MRHLLVPLGRIDMQVIQTMLVARWMRPMEIDGSSLIACGEAPDMFEPVEAAFDAVARHCHGNMSEWW